MGTYHVSKTGNPCAKYYHVSEGHPPYTPRTRFLGELSGSWYDIGHQIGVEAGDLVRWVSDVWWKEHIETYGFEDTMKAMSLYEAQVAALNTDLIQFMHGVSEGATEELEKSPYAKVSSHYHKILNTNIFDAWSWRHPTSLPWNSKDTSKLSHPPPSACPSCSSFVTIGTGPNQQNEMIAAHNRHCPFNPKCYM